MVVVAEAEERRNNKTRGELRSRAMSGCRQQHLLLRKPLRAADEHGGMHV